MIKGENEPIFPAAHRRVQEAAEFKNCSSVFLITLSIFFALSVCKVKIQWLIGFAACAQKYTFALCCAMCYQVVSAAFESYFTRITHCRCFVYTC